jgi:gamma-glutamyltranspeptidase/glutathione hydrolase
LDLLRRRSRWDASVCPVGHDAVTTNDILDKTTMNIVAPTSQRTYRNGPTDNNCFYSDVSGRRAAIATHNFLSALAAADVIRAGGNAVDAAVAAVFVEGLVNPQMHTIGGECPMLIKMADQDRVVAINGNMAAPGLATPKAFLDRGFADVPDEGILSAGVPAAFGALLTALRRFGRLSFSEVAANVLELARNGFPASPGLIRQERHGLRDLAPKFTRQWPGSAQLYIPDGRVPEVGELVRNPALADMYSYLSSVEKAKAHDSRDNQLSAVVEAFYRGDIAAGIAAFSEKHDGLLTRVDLAGFETRIESPISVEFGRDTVFKCGPWTQGPAFLQTLSILKNFDLGSMGHNSANYLHHVIEAVKLAFADREQYYGDPDVIDVPVEALLSDAYGSKRSKLVSVDTANPSLRPGDPIGGRELLNPGSIFLPRPWGPGTVHVDVVDAEGNFVAATPSGGWLRSAEVIPGLGFALSCRMMTFYLGPDNHPNVVAPFKRPRTTLSPTLAYKDGKPWMAFGSMGGDQQDQWMLQFFLNRSVFGMTIQQAIEAPKFSSEHFPGFFAPHNCTPNLVRIEPRVDDDALKGLARQGHLIDIAPDWSEGFLNAAGRNPTTGLLEAGCDPRGPKSEVFSTYALAW